MDNLKKQWTDVAYWKSICPSLSISCDDGNDGDESSLKKPSQSSSSINGTINGGNQNQTVIEKEDIAITAARTGLLADGYALVDADSIGVDHRTLLPPTTNESIHEQQHNQQINTSSYNLRRLLKSGIETLTKEAGLPATFILLYDETWELAHGARTFLSEATHLQNQLNFDILAWYIDPRQSQSGFSPHRDRQPDDIAASFHSRPTTTDCDANINGPDSNNVNQHGVNRKQEYGMAKYVTMWMALSDATPENSCLYVIPAGSDPGYFAGDPVDDGQPDPLQRALQKKNDYQNIRALPRRAGESIIFTHRIMHWGSKGNVRCDEPRVAISFVVSSSDFERPYIDPAYFAVCGGSCMLPPFHVRLVLVCAQLLIYHQRFNLSSLVIRMCFDYCKEYESILEPTYFKKVNFEFIGAMKESKTMTSLDTGGEKSDGVDDEEDEEAILEAMLDADAVGHDMEDDFDDLENGSGGFLPTDEVSDEEDFLHDTNEGSGILFVAQPQKKKAKRG